MCDLYSYANESMFIYSIHKYVHGKEFGFSFCNKRYHKNTIGKLYTGVAKHAVCFGKAGILCHLYCNYRRSLVLMYMVCNEVLLRKMNEFESIVSCLIGAVEPTDYKRKPQS